MPKHKKPASIFGMPAGTLDTFGTGEVALILQTEIWRVQKYLDSPKYRLTSFGQLGYGRGSRRVFTDTDIYRLGIAEHLVSNGFSYKFVAKALQQIDDDDLLGPMSNEGVQQDLIYALVGGNENVQVRGIPRSSTVKEMLNRVKRP